MYHQVLFLNVQFLWKEKLVGFSAETQEAEKHFLHCSLELAPYVSPLLRFPEIQAKFSRDLISDIQIISLRRINKEAGTRHEGGIAGGGCDGGV